MDNADRSYWRMLYRLILLQVIPVVAVAGYFLLKHDTDFAIATLFGGAVTLLSTLVAAWRVKIATDPVEQGPPVSMFEIYKGSALKYLIVIALLALGFAGLKLDPAGIITGFVLAQAAFFFSNTRAGRK